MKSTSVARQTIMHDVCHAPYVADCPADGCEKCRFNGLKPKPYVQTCFLPKGEDCKGGACDGCCWYRPNRDNIAELKKVLEEKKLELDEGRDKYHLVREVGRLADENHVDKEIVFRMIRENNSIRGSRYWYGMGPCSDFFNNELQKYARCHYSDWRKFTEEFCRQLKEMDKENVQEPKHNKPIQQGEGQMTNQLMLTQVRLVYEYLHDEVTRCKNGSAPLSLLSHRHVLETARNGLFMVIRDTIGEGYDERHDEKMEAVGKDEELPPLIEPEKLGAAQDGNGVVDVVIRRKKNEDKKEAEIFGYPVSDWKRVLDENSVDCPGRLAAFLEGFEKYRRVVRNHGIKNGHDELDERLSILDEKQSDHKEKEA